MMTTPPTRSVLVAIVLACHLICQASPTQAQLKKFPLQTEIMAQPNVGQRVQVQRWAEVFQKTGRSATFRQGKQGERTRVEETKYGNRKGVLLVGIMNRDGSITVMGQTLRTSDSDKLDAILNILEEHGAGGPPNKNPTWGLNTDEFKAVLQLLAARVDAPIDFRSSVAAIESLALSKEFTVRFTEAAAARQVLPAAQMGDLQPNCIGISKGTALAIALAQFGLGFRPKSNAAGGFVIEVDVGDEADNMYPVGWKNTQPIFNALPAIGKTLPVDLEPGTPLDRIVALIADKLAVPHFYSAHQLLSDAKDISKMTYNRKPDKLAVNRLMNILSRANAIAADVKNLRTDEAGTIFLWITTEANGKAFNERFPDAKPSP